MSYMEPPLITAWYAAATGLLTVLAPGRRGDYRCLPIPCTALNANAKCVGATFCHLPVWFLAEGLHTIQHSTPDYTPTRQVAPSGCPELTWACLERRFTCGAVLSLPPFCGRCCCYIIVFPGRRLLILPRISTYL